MSLRAVKPAVSYTRQEAAEATGIGLSRISAALADGSLPKHYLGSTPLILADDLAEWIRSLPTEPT